MLSQMKKKKYKWREWERETKPNNNNHTIIVIPSMHCIAKTYFELMNTFALLHK